MYELPQANGRWSSWPASIGCLGPHRRPQSNGCDGVGIKRHRLLLSHYTQTPSTYQPHISHNHLQTPSSQLPNKTSPPKSRETIIITAAPSIPSPGNHKRTSAISNLSPRPYSPTATTIITDLSFNQAKISLIPETLKLANACTTRADPSLSTRTQDVNDS
ncbi:hypothetical protein HBI56_104250 [Parastagonospora nodorum]|nr:hypothetical protein HBH56_134660 [Parastagonospora nodorum]KAH3927027.1 hypothetical protein HBH54_158630 [Parastagonospora nodorum]KAH3949358.1 hypothetical protein HBH53_089720 [Parastagonospora nodorum]KAH3958836.1 hypothetical protein HBH51_204870 [Parastagonospora nodorum]KAH3974622.1 hypothetical protein HBH52_132030 [Parastagonospora nodorum]